MNLTVPDRPFAVRPTTWIEPERLRAALGIRVTLVTETFQRTGSFKFRAAFHRARTSPAPHLLAASSGNFGQALALACKLLSKRATIVMPSISARVKIEAVRSHGAQVEFTDVEKESREDAVDRLLSRSARGRGNERLRRSSRDRRERHARGGDRDAPGPLVHCPTAKRRGSGAHRWGRDQLGNPDRPSDRGNG